MVRIPPEGFEPSTFCLLHFLKRLIEPLHHQLDHNELKRVYGDELDPNALIGDAAAAITNGFEQVFPDKAYQRIVCWAHVIRNIDTRLD
ncbi:hypothetical protein BpHYR1_006248 [Brachionus plicatilis]|uniref:MULE transposase domain-containing protein n=1 Tax=Brachionus plicatilis TaxID=10195 RepID=A0A3M7SYR8_BRAPC|nr:hypothetical protein BpHYR1_006248 [Brachionus plicatilis]